MTERNYNEKLRAVFLAAIMVTSVFTGAVALSGSAAAFDVGSVSAPTNSAEYGLQDDGILFAGQNNLVRIDETLSPNSVQVRRITSVGSASPGSIDNSEFVEEITVEPADSSSDLSAEIDTEGFESGRYFVSGASDSDPTNVNDDNTQVFEITQQSVSANFVEDDQPALPGAFGDSRVELDVSSARSNFNANVSADGDLDDTELFNIMATAQLADVSDIRVSDTGQIDIRSGLGGTNGSFEYESAKAAFEGALAASSVTGSAPPQITDAGSVTIARPSGGVSDAPDLTVDRTDTTQFATSDGDEVTNLGNRLQISANSQVEIGLYADGQDGEDLNFDEKVLITSGEFDEEDVSFVDISEDDYSFNFEVVDTESSANADVSVSERDADASFSQGTQSVPAGGIAEFNLTLADNDETYVQIGSEDTNFVEVLYLEADDASEPMEVRFNTRLLGTTRDVSQGDVYDTTNVDTIESAIYSAAKAGGGSGSDIERAGSLARTDLYEDDGDLPVASGSNTAGTGADTVFESYLDAMDIIDIGSGENVGDQLVRPTQSAEYQISVAGYTGEDKVFDADPGGEANNQLASQSLELTQPEIGDITVHTAPEDDADATTDVQELVDAATVRDEIAVDDRVVVQVEATGITGALVAGVPTASNYDANTSSDSGPQSVDFDRLNEGASTQRLAELVETNENVDFEVIADSETGNQAPLEVDLTASDSETFLVLDQDNGQFFLVADTSSDSAFANGDAPDEEVEFEAFMEYDADDGDNRYEFAGTSSSSGVGVASAPFSQRSGGSYQNFPYLLQGEVVDNTVQLEFAPRSISFDNLNEGGQIQVANSESAELSGTTNVAPGTDAEIRLVSSNASSSFQLGNDVNITEDGSITTTYDVSNQEVGDVFDANYRVEGSSVDSTEGVLVESISEDEETNETEPEPEPEPEPEDDGEMNESADDGSADDGGSTDDGTPGFGAVVALVALIGAALLAVRRQN